MAYAPENQGYENHYRSRKHYRKGLQGITFFPILGQTLTR